MSAFSDAQSAYLANADYAETASVSKAQAFITACRKLILLLSSEIQTGDNRNRADENLRQFRIEMQDADQWLIDTAAASANGGGTLHVSFEEFR
jgi:type IV secretory pathway VirB4 component